MQILIEKLFINIRNTFYSCNNVYLKNPLKTFISFKEYILQFSNKNAFF